MIVKIAHFHKFNILSMTWSTFSLDWDKKELQLVLTGQWAIFIWTLHYFLKITLFITFKVAPDQKIRELPIHESLTALAAGQLGTPLPSGAEEEGTGGKRAGTKREGKGALGWEPEPRCLNFVSWTLSSSDYSVSSQGLHFLTWTLEIALLHFQGPAWRSSTASCSCRRPCRYQESDRLTYQDFSFLLSPCSRNPREFLMLSEEITSAAKLVIKPDDWVSL